MTAASDAALAAAGGLGRPLRSRRHPAWAVARGGAPGRRRADRRSGAEGLRVGRREPMGWLAPGSLASSHWVFKAFRMQHGLQEVVGRPPGRHL